MTTKRLASIGFSYKEFTFFSDIDETIIREAELNVLILGDDSFGIYDKSGLSSKKRKRDVDIYEYNPSVSAAWKKNVTDFFSRITITANKNLLSKPI